MGSSGLSGNKKNWTRKNAKDADFKKSYLRPFAFFSVLFPTKAGRATNHKMR
jgi:hypothetical protein